MKWLPLLSHLEVIPSPASSSGTWHPGRRRIGFLLHDKLKQYLFTSAQFCRSEVRAQCGWVLCAGPHKDTVKVSAGCFLIWSSESSAKLTCLWQNSVASNLRAEVPDSLLATCWEPFSAPRGCHHFLTTCPPPSSKPEGDLHFESLSCFKSF